MTVNVDGKRPRIALTMGDLSGVGPELAAKLVSEGENRAKANIYVLASVAEIKAAAKTAGVDIPLCEDPGPDAVCAAGSELADEPVAQGKVSVQGGRRALADLGQALQMYEAGQVDALMFSPLNKAALYRAGLAEEDELRWFAKQLNFEGTTSELNVVPGLTTSRVTSHIPLSQVAEHINARGVAEAIRLLDRVIRDTGVMQPRIAVCALNPHAGEGGKFGREEIDHIGPGISLAQHDGIDASGPYPCDTIFLRARDGDFDGVVTMYHDQGQIAMKLMGFDLGVTVQGGLPVPIATPAHGTAYEIVGRGIAKTGPSQHAFDLAVTLATKNMNRGDYATS